MTDEAQGALTQLQAWLAQRDLPSNARLPPERELCELLGVSRGELRKALAVLERNGDVWRHVGKGTFTGARPLEEFGSVAAVAARTDPVEVMEARLLMEPMLAREAARAARAEDLAALRDCLSASRQADSWRRYENWDNRLHRAVAEAARNTLLLALFDQLNAVRRTVVWDRRRAQDDRPPPDHHSFNEHEALVRAIAARDGDAAEQAMRAHLRGVAANLLGARLAAE